MDYVGMAMQLGVEILEQLPNYEQRKRERYYKMVQDYKNEIVRPADLQDHALIITLRKDIYTYLASLLSEIKDGQ